MVNSTDLSQTRMLFKLARFKILNIINDIIPNHFIHASNLRHNAGFSLNSKPGHHAEEHKL